MNSQTKLQSGKDAFEAGRYFESEQILADAIRDGEALPAQEQAEIWLEHGRVLDKLAKYDKALEYVIKARNIFEQTPGTNSYEYSEALHVLGMHNYELSNLDEAQSLLHEALRIRKEIYNPPHKDIARLMHHLGESYWKQGDQKAALNYLDQALEMQKQTIGDKHEHYSDTLGDKALVLMRLGRLEESEGLIRQGLKIRQERLSPDHALIGNSLANLAFVLKKQGKHDDVEDMQRQSIEIMIKAYGEDNPHTGTCINNLGGYYLHRGNLIEAAKHFERALAIKERVLGKDNPGLVNPFTNLAIVYERLNRIEEAAQMRDRAKAILTAKIEDPNRKDIDSMILLADKLAAEKKRDEALALAERGLKIACTEYGADSLKAAQVLEFMASQYKHSDLDKAKDCLVAIVRIKKAQLGKKHSEVAKALRGIASYIAAQGGQEVAQLLQEQALAIEHAAGMEDPEIASMQKAINQLRDKEGTSQALASNLRLFAAVLERKGRMQESNVMFDEYVKLRERELGPDTVAIAHEFVIKGKSVLPMMAAFPDFIINIGPEDADEAITWLQKAARIFEKHLETSKDDSDLLSALVPLALVYLGIKQYDTAEATARHALACTEKCRGENHWALGTPLRTLHKILLAEKKTEEAESVEQRINALPKPSKAEIGEESNRLRDRLSAAYGSLLSGLQVAAAEQQGGNTGTNTSTLNAPSTAQSAQENEQRQPALSSTEPTSPEKDQ